MTEPAAAVPTRETWSSRTGFLLATIGAAVGLGNIWRFPFVAGENGGGAFVLVYLGFVLVIGVPIAMAEVLLGRRGRASPVAAMRRLAREEGRGRGWVAIGWFAVTAPLIALAFYSVVASWSLEYILRSALGLFKDISPEASGAVFAGLVGSPWRLILWHSIFMGLTAFVVARGVRGGLEAAARLMTPALFLLLLVMIGYGIVAADFAGAVRFLFRPDFSELSGTVVLMALGQAFFSISVGGGYLFIYGSYMPRTMPVPRNVAIICVMDSVVALLAGLAIFPIVLAFGFETDGGPGLVFESLPTAFGVMPFGQLLGVMFFFLLGLAAFTSTVAMLEPATSWLAERHGWRRRRVAPLAALIAWSFGIVVALSFNVWSDVRPLGPVPLLGSMGIFQLLDFLIANLLLPLNALLIALFVGWFMARQGVAEELGMRAGTFRLWRAATRYLAPAAILAVLVFTAATSLDAS